MVELKDVSKTYVGGNKVLDQISLGLSSGDFLYVVGGSGAGKSSLLRMLAGEEVPSEGSVSLFGYNLNKVSKSTLQAIRKAIGFIPQDLRLISDLTVWENISLSIQLSGNRALNSQLNSRIHELLEKFSLMTKAHTMVEKLSGGEKQRVAVARALVRAPQLLIADEPTGSQDRDHTWSMMELILKANSEGTAVVLATHDKEIVRKVRKRSALLKSGKVIFEDPLCYI